jgi:hypothetical protein
VASGDGTVDVMIRSMPLELRTMIERYQNVRRMSSFSRAVIELLETHPEVRQLILDTLYTG